MTNAFGLTGKLRGASVLVGWAKAVISRFSRAVELRGMDRTEFERIAQDLNLSPPQLYGLLTGRRIAAETLEQCLAAEFEASPQLATRLRAVERKHRAAARISVPIAPCC